MKIVATGALGHIGSRVIRKLPEIFSESEIVMIDNMSAQRYCSLFNLPVEGKYRFIETDVLETDLGPIIENADVVLHLAAITDATSSFGNKEQVEHVNYNATVRVAEACNKYGACMIHLSSTSVYGTQCELVDEECSGEELKPQSPYAETKLKEERFLHDLGDKEKLRFIICRFGTIAGISQGMRFHTAVNKFCWQAVMGQPLTVWSTALHQKRPYLTLDDAINAVCFIIKNDIFDRKIYNILSENLTVNDIIQSIKQHIPELEIQYVDTQIMNQLSYEVSNLRFREHGFKFSGSVERSIYDTIHLLRTSCGKQV
ncbi:MAG: SDR family oxidoreductase [Desulfobacterales bacterium]|nr:SDR family oxidoreductase [Desulfobacterales bacterium]